MKRTITSVAVASLLVLALAGCETYGQGAGLGAGIGAASGAIIGAQSGHALEGAAIGAAVGAAAGAVAHDIKVRRERSREQTVAEYQYVPAQGERLALERVEVIPQVVRPGRTIESAIQYAILGTGPGVEVTERRTLMKGDRVVAELSSEMHMRDDGTYYSSQTIMIGTDLSPGIYTINTRVTTRAGSAVSGNASFTVQ